MNSKVSLATLPLAEKKVAARVLTKQGYSSRRLEQLLGMDNVSVWRASQEATPEELKQFETDFIASISEIKKQGISLGMKRLIELIPRERRIDQVVKAVEFMEGRSTGNDNPNLKKRIVAEEFFT